MRYIFYDGRDDNDNGVQDMAEGRFRVRRLDGKKNEYMCLRLSGGGVREKGQSVNLDVGFVMRSYNDEIQINRERGGVTTSSIVTGKRSTRSHVRSYVDYF